MTEGKDGKDEKDTRTTAPLLQTHLNQVPLGDAQLAVVPGREVVDGACVQGGLAGARREALTVAPGELFGGVGLIRRRGGGRRWLPAIVELWDVG